MAISYKKLWKLLIDKDMKKKDLCEKAGISPASVTKMGRNGHVTTEILLKICTALDCSIEDIMEIVPDKCPQVTATASQIPWALDDGIGTMLPVMQSDIMLTRGNEVLIIDAKYYTHTTQAQYDVHTLHSGNLYQIFTYVKNKAAEFGNEPHQVSGMLLYAATDEAIQPDNRYRMSGNQISVKTLDLNKNFSEISAQLNRIVEDHFL